MVTSRPQGLISQSDSQQEGGFRYTTYPGSKTRVMIWTSRVGRAQSWQQALSARCPPRVAQAQSYLVAQKTRLASDCIVQIAEARRTVANVKRPDALAQLRPVGDQGLRFIHVELHPVGNGWRITLRH